MRHPCSVVSALFFVGCAVASPPVRHQPARCPPAPPAPRAAVTTTVEWVSLEPSEPGDPARWTLRLGDPSSSVRLHSDERGETDCRGPLARQGADGRWWCMRVDSDLVRRRDVTLDRATPRVEFDLAWSRSDGERRPLPPGRYRLSLLARGADREAPWREVRRFFTIASAAGGSGEALLRRVIAQQSPDCPPAPLPVIRALGVALTPAQIAPLLAAPGALTDDRVRAITALIELPEVRGWLRDELTPSRSSYVASCVVLQRGSSFDRDAREAAEYVFASRLPSEPDVGTSAIYAAHRSSWSSAIVLALAERIQHTRSASELTHWLSVFACPSPRMPDGAHLGELSRALRDAAGRMRREDPTLAAGLEARANEVRATLARLRAGLDAQLRVATNGARPRPSRSDGSSCGFGLGESRRLASSCPREPWPTAEELVVARGAMTLEPSAPTTVAPPR